MFFESTIASMLFGTSYDSNKIIGNTSKELIKGNWLKAAMIGGAGIAKKSGVFDDPREEYLLNKLTGRSNFTCITKLAGGMTSDTIEKIRGCFQVTPQEEENSEEEEESSEGEEAGESPSTFKRVTDKFHRGVKKVTNLVHRSSTEDTEGHSEKDGDDHTQGTRKREKVKKVLKDSYHAVKDVAHTTLDAIRSVARKTFEEIKDWPDDIGEAFRTIDNIEVKTLLLEAVFTDEDLYKIFNKEESTKANLLHLSDETITDLLIHHLNKNHPTGREATRLTDEEIILLKKYITKDISLSDASKEILKENSLILFSMCLDNEKDSITTNEEENNSTNKENISSHKNIMTALTSNGASISNEVGIVINGNYSRMGYYKFMSTFYEDGAFILPLLHMRNTERAIDADLKAQTSSRLYQIFANLKYGQIDKLKEVISKKTVGHHLLLDATFTALKTHWWNLKSWFANSSPSCNKKTCKKLDEDFQDKHGDYFIEAYHSLLTIFSMKQRVEICEAYCKLNGEIGVFNTLPTQDQLKTLNGQYGLDIEFPLCDRVE